MKKLIFLFLILLFAYSKATDVTLVVVADTHFDPPPETDQFHHILAINNLVDNFVWKDSVGGKKTHFGGKNSKLKHIDAVIVDGDLTDKADSSALNLFKQRYEKGFGEKQIHFPCYIGLGNHDINPHVKNPVNKKKRINMMFDYLKSRHFDENSNVKAKNFDLKSLCYSWNIGQLHIIQLNTAFGDTAKGRSGYKEWLESDLKKYASNNQPVLIFQHYGFDKWALTWWTDQQRTDLFETISKYNVLTIIAGHTHKAIKKKYDKYQIFETNNAWDDKDSKASFFVIHITDKYMDITNCKVLDDKGNFEIAKPFYTQKIKK